MNIELPNGTVIEGVPEGTSKEDVMRKAIESGLASESDFQVEQTEPALPVGSALDAVVEPVQAIAGGAINQAISGLAGLGNIIQTNDSAQGAKRIAEVQQSLPDFAPETQAGQKGLQKVGDLAQLGIDIVNFPISGLAGLATLIGGGGVEGAANTVKSVQDDGLGQTLGDATFEATGSPLAATAAQMAPDAVLAAVGGKGAQAGINNALKKIPKRTPRALIDDAGKFRPDFKKALESEGVTLESIFPEDIARLPANIKPKRAAQEIIKRRLKAGDTDGFLALKKLDDSGRVIDDDIAKAAMGQGFESGDIQFIKTASDATKEKFARMIRSRREIKDNTVKALKEQPSNVIGEAAFDRVALLRDKITDARKGLDSLVRGRLDNTPIDVKPIATKFAEELKALKVSIKDGKLDFDGSLISKDRASKQVIKDALDLMNEPGKASALRAHELKKQLDTMLDYKRSASKLTPTGERLVQGVRRELNEAIRKVDSEYGDLNDIMHEALTAIDDFESSMGSKFSIFDSNGVPKAGNRLRKMLTRYGVSDDQISAIRQLDDVAQELGGNFRDDIEHLTMFNRVLEDRFGSVRRGSFEPTIEKSIDRAMRGREGIKDAAFDVTAQYIKKKLLDQSDYEAFRTLQELSKTKGKQTQAGLPATR